MRGPGDPMRVGKVSEVQPGQSPWARKSGWPQALPAVLGSGEGGKRRKDSLGAILGCSRTGEEFSKSGGRGSGERVVCLGTFRGRAPPPRRRPRASNTSGRGAEREIGQARSCAATPSTAAQGAGKGARRWAGSAAPRAQRGVGALASSRCHGHEPSIFGLSFLLRVPWLPSSGLNAARGPTRSSSAECERSALRPGQNPGASLSPRGKGCQEQVTCLVRAEGLTEKPRRWCCLPGTSVAGCPNVGAE